MLVDQSFTAGELGTMLGLRGSRLLAVVRASRARAAQAQRRVKKARSNPWAIQSAAAPLLRALTWPAPRAERVGR